MPNGTYRLSISQSLGLVVIAVSATWAVLNFTVGSERHVDDTFTKIEERAVVIHKDFIRKDQFSEFKERFDKVVGDLDKVQSAMIEVRSDLKFLVAKAEKDSENY